MSTQTLPTTDHPESIASSRKKRERGNALTGLIMILPAFLLIAVFTIWPFARAIRQSTRIESPIFPSQYVGLQNYRDVWNSFYFRDAAETSLLFTLVTVPSLLILGILVALLLNEPFHGNTALRIGMLLPWALPATASGLIWKWIFLDSWGALNAGLYSIGAIDEYVHWLTNSDLARLSVIIVFVWSQLPLAAVFLLASMQSIPEELYAAAAVDGASSFGRFRSVTLPGIRPMLIIVALFEILMAFTSFDIVYSLTQGGPGTATTILSYFTWVETFKRVDFGRGSALAIMIALASLVLILILIRAMPKGALEEERA